MPLRPIAAAPARPAPTRPPGKAGGAADQIRRYRNAQSWTFFDKQFFAAAPYVNPAILTLAAFPASLPIFSNRSQSTNGSSPAFASTNDVNKFDRDFLLYSIGVDADLDPDAPSPAAAHESTAQVFAHAVIDGGAILIKIGGDPVLHMPLTDCPGGGGVFYGPRVRTEVAAGAITDSGGATNGIPDARARKYLREPVFFKQNQAFSVSLEFAPVAVARLAALTALAGNSFGVICVKFEGIRGKPLLEGVADPGLAAKYAQQAR